MKKNILFICKHNVFRSRVAASYFKKINKNPNLKGVSAGLIKGSRLNKEQVKAAKKFKLNIRGVPRSLTEKILNASDRIIIVADDVPKKIFSKESDYYNRVIIWKIKDQKIKGEKHSIAVIKEIIKKVENLNNKWSK